MNDLHEAVELIDAVLSYSANWDSILATKLFEARNLVEDFIDDHNKDYIA